MQGNTDLGDFREKLGEMRGQLNGLQSSVNRLEGQVAANQAINALSHDKNDAAMKTLDDKIDTIDAKLAIKLVEDGAHSRVKSKVWEVLSGGLGGAVTAFCLDWFTKR